MSTTDKFAIDEREWEAQERGMRAALGRDAGGMDAAVASYRVVAKAMISAPHSEPPADFAASVTERIVRQEVGFERLLARILLAVFVIASIFVAVRYGGPWWQSLQQTLGADALGWLVAGAGCMVLSWICRQLRELASHPGDLRHTA